MSVNYAPLAVNLSLADDSKLLDGYVFDIARLPAGAPSTSSAGTLAPGTIIDSSTANSLTQGISNPTDMSGLTGQYQVLNPSAAL